MTRPSRTLAGLSHVRTRRGLAAWLLWMLFDGGAAHAAGEFDRFNDPDDGAFDLSEWLLDQKGFLPVPIIITEPAVGFGGGVMLAFFRESIREAANQKAPDGRLTPPEGGSGPEYTLT